VERIAAAVTAEQVMAMLEADDILVDCTGSNSLLRDQVAPPAGEAADGGTNTFKIRLEYALVVTFLYSQTYICDEYCKYYKNVENERYKFIPAVHRTYYDQSVSHVTGIVKISAEEFEAMPPRFDGRWLRDNFPGAAQSMDRFIQKMKHETGGEILGELEIIRIPLDLYRAAMRPAGNGALWVSPTTLLQAHRFFWSAIRLLARHTFSQFRWASSVQCFWLDFLDRAINSWRKHSTDMSTTFISNGSGSTCAAR
jgi:hypothetical protein